ncbi:Set1 complex component shg1 [Elsinoe australis]|uniref:Set1 complex component shg1 n=1 Tax=Elsinoe australis TaxID=40998 RepID=A0A2P7Z4B2_9PEZI|nr:Set1 complex component shg1 [Elsinoe australis]
MAAVEGVRIGGDDGPIRKKPRISELPTSSAKQSEVGGLVHVFKRKGEFDSLRKQVYAQFEAGDSKNNLLQSLQTFADEEIERDSLKYLDKHRNIAASLLEGSAARANIYPTTEAEINKYISEILKPAEAALREIRRKEIGDDAAQAEELKGAKSDEAYGAEAEIRRQERAKQFQEEQRIKKKKEQQLAKQKMLESLQARAAELAKETERLQREQKRRAEREAARAKQKQMEEERRKKFAEDREKREKEQAEAAKREEEENERRRKEREAAEAKRLEQEALLLLEREAGRLTEKREAVQNRHQDGLDPAGSQDWQPKDQEARPPDHRRQSASDEALVVKVLQDDMTMIDRREPEAHAATVTAWIGETASRSVIAVAVLHGGDETTRGVRHVGAIALDLVHHHDGCIAIETIHQQEEDHVPGLAALQISIDTCLVQGDVTTVETTAVMIEETGIGTGVGTEETGIGTTIGTDDDLGIRTTVDAALATGQDHEAARMSALHICQQSDA